MLALHYIFNEPTFNVFFRTIFSTYSLHFFNKLVRKPYSLNIDFILSFCTILSTYSLYCLSLSYTTISKIIQA